MRILVTGKDGQVGGELARLFPPDFEVVSAGRTRCDLSSQQAIRDLVRQVKPEVIVNAAAYTAVDKAESEPDLCFAVNAAAPRVLAEEAARLDALLVHYSTDYVFDGQKTEPYTESDPICPLGVYGASKAEGETAIAASAGRWLVLRTSWVYAPQGKNFLRTILRLAAERTRAAGGGRSDRVPNLGRVDRRGYRAPGGEIRAAPGGSPFGCLSHDGERFDFMVRLCAGDPRQGEPGIGEPRRGRPQSPGRRDLYGRISNPGQAAEKFSSLE